MQSKLLVWREGKRKLSSFLIFICVANSRPNIQWQEVSRFCTECYGGWNEISLQPRKESISSIRVKWKQQILPFNSAFYIKEQKPVCYKMFLASSLYQKCCFATEREWDCLCSSSVCVCVCFYRVSVCVSLCACVWDRTVVSSVIFASLKCIALKRWNWSMYAQSSKHKTNRNKRKRNKYCDDLFNRLFF